MSSAILSRFGASSFSVTSPSRPGGWASASCTEGSVSIISIVRQSFGYAGNGLGSSYLSSLRRGFASVLIGRAKRPGWYGGRFAAMALDYCFSLEVRQCKGRNFLVVVVVSILQRGWWCTVKVTVRKDFTKTSLLSRRFPQQHVTGQLCETHHNSFCSLKAEKYDFYLWKRLAQQERLGACSGYISILGSALKDKQVSCFVANTTSCFRPVLESSHIV